MTSSTVEPTACDIAAACANTSAAGSDIEYADEVTMTHALENRRTL